VQSCVACGLYHPPAVRTGEQPPHLPLTPPQALLARSPNALLATSVRANEVGDEARRLLEPSRMLSEYAPRGLAFVVDGGPRPAEVSTVRLPPACHPFLRHVRVCIVCTRKVRARAGLLPGRPPRRLWYRTLPRALPCLVAISNGVGDGRVYTCPPPPHTNPSGFASGRSRR